mgnify:CR=1 FL=1
MSKMQWQVSWNVARSSRRARSRASLVLVSLLGWLLIMAPAYAEEPQLGAEYRPLVQKVIDAAKARDPQALARQMKYPFKQEYPIPVIKNPSEMVARFDEVFDDALLNSIASSRVGQDWQAMGWRGIMLGSGEVWLDFDGKVIGINHQTAQAAKRKAELVAKQKSDLYPGLREYQKHRVCTLLDPTSDPLGKGFHIIQSTIAIGSGGVFGKGWGKGTQTHLDFLPERHTDFIFAVLTEEFGLAGALFLVVVYILLIFRGLFIAAGAPTLFSRLLAGALTLIFFTYAFVNMGMVSGILPVVGVPLPFVSYGGTALVTLCLGVGMLMSIQRHRRRVGT